MGHIFVLRRAARQTNINIDETRVSDTSWTIFPQSGPKDPPLAADAVAARGGTWRLPTDLEPPGEIRPVVVYDGRAKKTEYKTLIQKLFFWNSHVRSHSVRRAHCRGPPALTSAATPRASSGTPGRAERPAAEPATHTPHARPARAQHAAKPASHAHAPATMSPNSGSAEGPSGLHL